MRHQYYLQLLTLTCLTTFVALVHQPSARAQGDSGFKFLEVKVVDPAGKPVADVAVDVKIDQMEFPMPTDDAGMISLNVPSGANTRVRLRVTHEDFVADSVNWRGAKQIPDEFTIKLEKGVPIGGIVQDTKGNPIDGVKVTAAMQVTITGGIVEMTTMELGTTDHKGRWQVQAKDEPTRQLQLKLEHDDYLTTNSFSRLATWEQLKSLDHIFELQKGISLDGTVVSEAGEPIADARVFLGNSRYISSNDKKKKTANTDDQGKFHFGNIASGSTIVTVTARGWAPELRTVNITRDMEPVEFKLKPGKTIRVLVTDVDGIPASGVGIAADEWRGNRTLPNEIYRGSTDDKGIWQCDSMSDEKVKFDLFSREHMSSRNNWLQAGKEPHTIVMKWPLIVTGKVVDSESGLPIEKFNVVQGIDWGNRNQQPHWERYNIKQGSHGKYETKFTEPRSGHYVRIEAEGYRPGVSRLIKSDEGEVSINFELEVGSGPSGIVRTPDGEPAAGVELIVATPSETISIYNGHAQQYEGRPTAKTDAEGRYQLPFFDSDNIRLICRHDTGFAQLTDEGLAVSSDITLQKWGIVEGTVREGDQPLANEPVQLYFNQAYRQGEPHVYWSYSATTDAEGKFKFDRVAGSEAIVARRVEFCKTDQGSMMSSYSHSQPVTLVPGEPVQVVLGGEGRSVAGQLVVPEEFKDLQHWNMCSVQIYEIDPSQQRNASGFFRALGQAIGQIGSQPAKPPKRKFRRSYASAVDEMGNFAITDVQPGQYQMTVQLYSLPQGQNYNWQPVGNLHQRIEIPKIEDEEPQDPIDLGELELKMTRPNVSQTTGNVFFATPVAAD